MKKILAVILAVLMLLMCTACGSDDAKKDDNEAAYDPNYVYEVPESLAVAESENPIVYFSMDLGDFTTGETESMTVYENEVSGCDVQYVGEEKKVGKFVFAVLDSVTAEFEKTGLTALNGQSVYEEGNSYGTMYISYADGSVVSADFSGAIPQEFIDGYDAMEKFFLTLTEQLPVYVPQPVLMTEVDEDIYAEMLSILNGSQVEALDAFTISAIEKDDTFSYMTGLSSAEGIANGTICQPMMMTNPYSLVVVTVEDAANIEAVRADFESSLDWLKWVCVAPTNALIAQKDNMVLCLMASDDLYNNTADAVAAAGWTELKELNNPNM